MAGLSVGLQCQVLQYIKILSNKDALENRTVYWIGEEKFVLLVNQEGYYRECEDFTEWSSQFRDFWVLYWTICLGIVHYLPIPCESKVQGKIYDLGINFPFSKRAQKFAGILKMWDRSPE